MNQPSFTQTLFGFIVSGTRKNPVGEVLKPVLAASKHDALKLFQDLQDEEGFQPTGLISEQELKEQLAVLAHLKTQAPQTTQTGFIVGAQSHGSAKMVALLAESMDEALVTAVQTHADLEPTGCLSEGQAKKLLTMIDKVRLASND